MNLILFGAGASYLNDGIIPYKPPLGNDLFHKLKEEYLNISEILNKEDIRYFEVEGFEDGMNYLFDNYPNKPWKLMQISGKYFTQFRLNFQGKKLDLYSNFLLQLRENSVLDNLLFSTLSYECLLEEAMLNTLKWDINTIYNHKLIKPHGSCNFWCTDPEEGSSGISISSNSRINIEISYFTEFNCPKL